MLDGIVKTGSLDTVHVEMELLLYNSQCLCFIIIYIYHDRRHILQAVEGNGATNEVQFTLWFLIFMPETFVIPKGTVVFCPTVRIFHSSSFSHFVFYESLCEQCCYPRSVATNKPPRLSHLCRNLGCFKANLLFFFDFCRPEREVVFHNSSVLA